MSLFALPLYHCKDEGKDVDVQGIHATGLSAVKLWISSNKDHLMKFTIAESQPGLSGSLAQSPTTIPKQGMNRSHARGTLIQRA